MKLVASFSQSSWCSRIAGSSVKIVPSTSSLSMLSAHARYTGGIPSTTKRLQAALVRRSATATTLQTIQVCSDGYASKGSSVSPHPRRLLLLATGCGFSHIRPDRRAAASDSVELLPRRTAMQLSSSVTSGRSSSCRLRLGMKGVACAVGSLNRFQGPTEANNKKGKKNHSRFGLPNSSEFKGPAG